VELRSTFHRVSKVTVMCFVDATMRFQLSKLSLKVARHMPHYVEES